MLFTAASSWVLQSVYLGMLLTFSLVVHELGHVLALRRFGVRWHVRFSVLGAATISPLAQRRRLSHFQNSLIHLAGPLANLAEALIFLAIYLIASSATRGTAGTGWLRAANFAALLVVFNLLPLGRLSDGGKFAQRLFASLSERLEARLLFSIAYWGWSIAWIAGITWGNRTRVVATAAIGIWYVVAMLIESFEDDPADALAPEAMTARQGAALFSIATSALIAGTALVMLAPFWLTTDDMLRMAQGYAGILAIFGAIRRALSGAA